MIKKLLILTALLIPAPAFAATKPTDVVNVMVSTENPKDPAIINEKIYAKPFNQLNLDQKTRDKIAALNKELDSSFGGHQKYRLTWIRIDAEHVFGFVFTGSRSTTYTIILGDQYTNWQDRYLYMGLDGNGIMKCREEKPTQD